MLLLSIILAAIISTNIESKTVKIIATTQNISDSILACKPKRIDNYLWQVGTEYEDWDKATNRVTKTYPSFGGCSGVTTTNLHGRTYDWYYDKCATIIVRAPKKDKTISCIGIADGLKTLTDDFLRSKQFSDAYYTIPYCWTDGMNEYGVVIQQNVVPTNYTKCSSWRTKKENSIICFMMIRYCLETCSNAYDAAVIMRDRTFIPSEFNYDSHYLVSDRNNSYIVEDGIIIDKSMSATDVLTNFRVKDTVTTNGTFVWNDVEPYGQGLERYEYVRSNGFNNSTLSGMKKTLHGLYFTRAYDISTSPFWYTEYTGTKEETGYDGLTVQNVKLDPSKFDGIKQDDILKYNQDHDINGQYYRSGKSWQTVHCCIYDKINLNMYIWVQEDKDNCRCFSLIENKINIE